MTVEIKKDNVSKNKNILSDENIEYINKNIATIFKTEGEKIISLDIVKLNEEIDKIINNIKLKEVLIGKNEIKKYAIENRQDLSNTLITEAYLLIFKIREFLTLENINYRYYYTSAKGPQVVTFTDNNFLKYVKNGKYGLQILDSAIKDAEKANEYQDLLNSHYEKLMKGLEPIRENSTVYHVHKDIHDRYVKLNPGLRKYPDTDDETYMLFNQGHIFEAMDKAFTEAIIREKKDNFVIIKNAMYGKYLKRDTGKGIKSGDNEMTMTQIKSRGADFMSYFTLLKAIQDIKEIFKVPPEIKKKELQNKLEEIFVDKNRYKTKKAYNEDLNKIFEKFFDSIENK